MVRRRALLNSKRCARSLLVKNQETFQDLRIMLIGHRAPNLGVELLVREGLRRLQALVRQRRPAAASGILRKDANDYKHERIGLISRRVVGHRKVHIKHADLHATGCQLSGTTDTMEMQTSSGCAWITSAIPSRVNVSSRNRRLILFSTSA